MTSTETDYESIESPLLITNDFVFLFLFFLVQRVDVQEQLLDSSHSRGRCTFGRNAAALLQRRRLQHVGL
jgi:hypothetical protein